MDICGCFFNAVHEKAKSFNLNVYLLFTMHFKQKMWRGLILSGEQLDVLMRETSTSSPYLVRIYGGLFREVCQLELQCHEELLLTTVMNPMYQFPSNCTFGFLTGSPYSIHYVL